MLVLILLLSYFLVVKSSGIPVEINSGTCESNGYVEATKDQCQYWYSKVNFPPPQVDLSYSNPDGIPGCSTDYQQTFFNNDGGNKDCGYSNRNCICWQPSGLIKSEDKCNTYITSPEECQTRALSLGLTFSSASHSSWESLYPMGCFMGMPNYSSSTSAQNGELSESIVYFNSYTNTLDCGRNNHNCICDTSCKENLVIPDGTVTFIEPYEGCTTLKTVSFPSSLRHIGERVFRETGLTSVVLPEGLETIGESLFEGCESLESISFPSTLETIPQEFCVECSALTTLTFAEGLKHIEGYTFENCPLLEEITFPDSLETIGEAAFKDSGLKRVYNTQGVSYVTDQGEDNTFPATTVSLTPKPYTKVFDGQCAGYELNRGVKTLDQCNTDCMANGFHSFAMKPGSGQTCYCERGTAWGAFDWGTKRGHTYSASNYVSYRCGDGSKTVQLSATESVTQDYGLKLYADSYIKYQTYCPAGTYHYSMTDCAQCPDGKYRPDEWRVTDGACTGTSCMLITESGNDGGGTGVCKGECDGGSSPYGSGKSTQCDFSHDNDATIDCFQRNEVTHGVAAWAPIPGCAATSGRTSSESWDYCYDTALPEGNFDAYECHDCPTGWTQSPLRDFCFEADPSGCTDNVYITAHEGNYCKNQLRGINEGTGDNEIINGYSYGIEGDWKGSVDKCYQRCIVELNLIGFYVHEEHMNFGCMCATDDCTIREVGNGKQVSYTLSNVATPSSRQKCLCKTTVRNMAQQYCVTRYTHPYTADTSLTRTEAIEKCTSACRPYMGFTIGISGADMDNCACRPYSFESCPTIEDQRTYVTDKYEMYDYISNPCVEECFRKAPATDRKYCVKTGSGYAGSLRAFANKQAHIDAGLATSTSPQDVFTDNCFKACTKQITNNGDPYQDTDTSYQDANFWSNYDGSDVVTMMVHTVDSYVGRCYCYTDGPSETECTNDGGTSYTESSGNYLIYNVDKSCDPDVECPIGKFFSSDEDNCKQCPSGKYGDEPGAIEASDCKECAKGKYGDQSGQTSCSECPEGFHQDAVAQSSCKVCGEGKFAASGDDVCSDCPVGWDSGPGESSCFNPDDCENSVCGNGGCIDGLGSYTCDCYPGWKKDADGNCNVDIDYCLANEDTACQTPEGDFGVCIDGNVSFSCDCSSTDYDGQGCTMKIDDCDNRDCGWGSQCEDLIRDYLCYCNDGTTSSYCEEPPDFCVPDPCGSYGICDSFTSSCSCIQGYSGTFCTLPPAPVDPCFMDPCGDYGTCVGMGSCDCLDGYSGIPCTFIDRCLPNPCVNYVQCHTIDNDYRCECETGWSGKDCNIDTDDCSVEGGGSVDCGHGTCIDQLGGFRCDCEDGWVTTTGYCDTNEDDCPGKDCGHGECVDEVNGFRCVCDDGWVITTGAACDENPDDCPTENTCSGNGYCIDGVNDYTCKCNTGYFGKDCESNVNYCEDVDCINGECEDKLTTFECECETGWGIGSNGKCTVDIDGCADSPCKNGGGCTDLVGGFECSCATGWEGSTCEVNPDDCPTAPCNGRGTCVDGLSAYTCDCGSSGYEGDHCELNKNDCLLGSCNSHGTCNDGVNSFTCSCHDGWEGDHCELSVDDCPSTPCSGHGTCVDEHKGYRCDCTTGFTGDLCNYEVNNCVGISCGEGICKNKPGGYDCECTPGWALKDGKCTENIDDCFVEGVGLIVCGDGVCQDGVNEYTCKCSLGFSGDHCETNIDECTPDPCENGVCTDGINDFTCACEGGWFGKRCDQECLVDSDCDYKCSKGKCVAYSFFGDFKFYMLGVWCVIAFVLVFLASLKSVHKRVVDFNKSEPEAVERQRYW